MSLLVHGCERNRWVPYLGIHMGRWLFEYQALAGVNGDAPNRDSCSNPPAANGSL